MNSSDNNNIICPVCSSTVFHAMKGVTRPPYSIMECEACGIAFVYPFPKDFNASEHYEIGYYSEWEDSQKNARIKLWKNRLADIQKYQRTGKLLDVGSGTGLFLKTAKDAGFEVFGNEMSQSICDYAKKTYGVELFRGTLLDAGLKDNTFDVITMWHVLEHMKDPIAIINETKRLLKPGGYMIIAVPNRNSFIYDLFYNIIKRKKRLLFDENDREVHLFHFSEKSLSFALKNNGFEVLAATLDDGQVDFFKKTLDLSAKILNALFRRQLGMSIKIYARKN